MRRIIEYTLALRSIGRRLGIACLSVMLTVEAGSQADRAQTLPAPQRIYLASRIYSAVLPPAAVVP
jgi:hypothetical protein